MAVVPGGIAPSGRCRIAMSVECCRGVENVQSAETSKSRLKIPQGCVIVPVSENQKQAALRICALVKVQPGSAGGSLITLRNTLDAKVFLGCIADVSGRVHEWLELWVQSADVLRNTSLAKRVFLSNAVLDDRWRKLAEVFDRSGVAESIQCGWEISNPLPTFLDVASRSAIHPKDEETGTYWQLCREESVLHDHGVPAYAGSLHRYLYLPGSGVETPLVPVTDDAPAGEHAKPLSEICPNHANLIPFNPAAGLMLVTRHYPMDLEGFIGLLGGARPRAGQSSPVVEPDENQNADGGGDWAAAYPGRLFLDSQGKHSRLIETFHLKLALLSDIVASVHSVVRSLQQPFLNLGASSFRVALDGGASLLPSLWTARARLVEPGHALTARAEATDVAYYLSPLIGETSVYRPVGASLPAKGRALVRVRKVMSDSKEAVTIEGTIATQERIELNASDLIILQLGLKSGDLCLHAHLEADSGLAGDEYRFRTTSHTLGAEQIHDLRSAEGVPVAEVPYEVIALLSSPCDLYSLAVLAVRILLVDRGTSLPVAVDEMLSLARQTQAECNPDEPLTACVARVFQSDERWLQSLGPHRLAEEGVGPEEALGLIPQELWWSTLAMIVQMFPGLGPMSVCRDYGDARPGGLHLVFERTLVELDALIMKSRYLVAPAVTSEMQIAAVIRQCLDSQPGQDDDVTTDTKE